MRIFISLFLMLLFSFLSAYIAKQRGRNPITWFIAGVLIGIFAPIILMFLKPLDKGEGKSIFCDPMDEEIEIKAIPLSITEQFSLKNWFYMDMSHQQQGPNSFLQMENLWKNQKINENTYVWYEGMSDWIRIKDVSDLQDSLS